MRFRLLLALAAVAASLAPTAAQEVTQEYRVKAGFLYNFVKYVEWPQPTFVGYSSGVYCES